MVQLHFLVLLNLSALPLILFSISSLPLSLSLSLSLSLLILLPISPAGTQPEDSPIPAAAEQTALCQQGHSDSPGETPLLVRRATQPHLIVTVDIPGDIVSIVTLTFH